MLHSTILMSILSLHLAFRVRKLHLGTPSDERNSIWTIMMTEYGYLTLKLLKCLAFKDQETIVRTDLLSVEM